jgi:uncharacterized protein (DUF608 family)
MGLTVAGYHEEAQQAFHWLKATQLADGSWWAATREGIPEDRTRDSNHASYLAVGLYHPYLATGDRGLLRELWGTMEAGIDFALSLQVSTGEIHWAKNGAGVTDRMALLTGSSSVYLSLKCALAVAALSTAAAHAWETARDKLGSAIRLRPSAFNMMKARYAMDWYYPCFVAP